MKIDHRRSEIIENQYKSNIGSRKSIITSIATRERPVCHSYCATERGHEDDRQGTEAHDDGEGAAVIVLRLVDDE